MKLAAHIVDDGSRPEPSGCSMNWRRVTTGSPCCACKLQSGQGRRSEPRSASDGRADFTHALQLDADGQHDLADVRVCSEDATASWALISRRPVYDESVPKGRFYGLTSPLVWVWLETSHFEIRDSMCGFRVYPLAATLALLDRHTLGQAHELDTG